MKKIFLSIIPLLFIACSSKPVQVEEQPSEAELILQRVMLSVFDSTVTLMDVKEDLSIYIDTLYHEASYHPDVDIRIRAKKIAMTLMPVFMDEQFYSPEEIKFFEDSFLIKMTAISQVWHIDIPTDPYEYPLMNQVILRQKDEDEKAYITELDLRLQPDSNFIIVFFPEDAVACGTIMFGKGDDVTELDDISFQEEDALMVYERTDSTNYAIIFGQDVIDAMMSHSAMFIGYVNDDFDKSMTERSKDCMTLLWSFHEQYPKFLKLR